MTTSRLGGFLRTERRLISAATHEALRFLGRAPGRRRSRPAPGAQPDAMAIAADAPAPRIEWLRFTPQALEERSVTDVGELGPALGSDTVDWIHVHGFGDEEQLRALAGIFGIHSLALADIVNIPQRAKVDSYDDQQLIVLRMARSVDRQIELQQLSLVVGPGVLTFEEHASDVFDPVRARLRADGSALRRSGADFLAYALIDAVVDGFFPMTDMLSDMLDDLEEAAIGDPEPHTLARIHAVRRLLIHLARAQRHQRDALMALTHQEKGPFGNSVRPYLRDVLDHAIHVLDTIETLRPLRGPGSLAPLLDIASSYRTSSRKRGLFFPKRGEPTDEDSTRLSQASNLRGGGCGQAPLGKPSPAFGWRANPSRRASSSAPSRRTASPPTHGPPDTATGT